VFDVAYFAAWVGVCLVTLVVHEAGHVVAVRAGRWTVSWRMKKFVNYK
jgi:hypothetical protein